MVLKLNSGDVQECEQKFIMEISDRYFYLSIVGPESKKFDWDSNV